MMRRVLLCFVATLSLVPNAIGAAELYDWDGQAIAIDPAMNPPCALPAGLRRQPLLFVHGHAADTSTDPNYKKIFWEDADDDFFLQLFDLTSFKKTFDDPINSSLDIEPYYIRFADRFRSITDDAFDIGQAVDCIIRRHNATFDPTTATTPPPVQIAIVAYSKGTLSTRQYLKSLQEQVQDNGGISLPPPRPGYRPVSEFIAIAPPNHGLASSPFGDPADEISVQQLFNGVRPVEDGCGAFANLHPQAANFIEILNGETEPNLDSNVSNVAPAPAEAPGSRASDHGPHSGMLYVTLFDNRDFVGGSSPSTTDCAGVGRALASNLSPQAINIPIAVPTSIPVGPLTVHNITVHAQDVICKALFAAAHHRSPSNQTCPQSGRVPIVPVPQPAAAMSRSTFPAACWHASALPARPDMTSSNKLWKSLRNCGPRPDGRTIAWA
jgi:hypothetical protein